MNAPNIICISVDSLRADCTSIYEDTEYDTTPFLRSLGTDSTVFTRAITPSTWTLPVHTSIFTGLYPPEHGIYGSGKVLGDHPTFAEILSENGYSTNAFYQNGWFDVADILRGFKNTQEPSTTQEDSTTSSSPSVKKRIATSIGAVSSTAETLLESGFRLQNRYRLWKYPPSVDKLNLDDRPTIDEAIDTLDSAETPLCWFIHFNDAHWKYTPPSPYHKSFTERSTLGLAYNREWWQYRVYDSPESRFKSIAGNTEPPDREITTFKNLYRGCIKYCDSLISELVSALKRAGLWNNTVLIVFGDHGDGFGENDVFGHHFSVRDSIIRVPLLIRDPTDTLENGVVTSPVSLLDIYPTVLKLAGTSIPETKAIDLSTETREYAYTYYDGTHHKPLQQIPQMDVEKDQLPPMKQFAVWKSPDKKVINYPDAEDHIKVGAPDDSLLIQLKNHTRQLEQTSTDNQEINENVTERLKQMGYLTEN